MASLQHTNEPILRPVSLIGPKIRLDPYHPDDFETLFQTSQFPEIWKWMSFGKMPTRAEFDGIVNTSLSNQTLGKEILFTIRSQVSGQILGSTRLFEFSSLHRSAEIGWTWLLPSLWKQGINPESKYLLLRHAFDTLGLVRVQLKADSRNLVSQSAILKIGAKREGLLRNHMIQRNTNYVRDSVIFSIINQEWPDIKAYLETKLSFYPDSKPDG